MVFFETGSEREAGTPEFNSAGTRERAACRLKRGADMIFVPEQDSELSRAKLPGRNGMNLTRDSKEEEHMPQFPKSQSFYIPPFFGWEPVLSLSHSFDIMAAYVIILGGRVSLTLTRFTFLTTLLSSPPCVWGLGSQPPQLICTYVIVSTYLIIYAVTKLNTFVT
jgi:hypothetical protein